MARSIIKQDACIKFYDEIKPLYMETDASGARLGASLLQTRGGTSFPRDEAPDNRILRPMTLMSNSLSSVEKRYSNKEREGLGILYSL